MTNIKKIADDCASRIMDRMEMCRGSAILKGDIAREVELALMEASLVFEPEAWVDEEAPIPVSIVDRALKALGEQAFEKPDTTFIEAYADAYRVDPWSFARGEIVRQVQWSVPEDPEDWR